jgi:hypothetical protein
MTAGYPPATGFAEFDRLGSLFRRTRALLDVALRAGDLPAGGELVLADETLPHVEAIESGFRGWLQARWVDDAVLRDLVRHAALDAGEPADASEGRAARAEEEQEASGIGGSRQIVASAGARLVALGHARLVFALLPRTPEDDVRFPEGRRTYADIGPPRSPAELMFRIEELERAVWQVATGRAADPNDPGVRRTYGFFDVGEQLASRDLHA